MYTDTNWCNFERGQRYSTVQYSKLSGSAVMDEYGDIGIADLLAVFLR